MASELRVNTLKDANGNNSIATSFVAGGSAKIRAHHTGDSPTTNESFNMSGLTDDGPGRYSYTFSSPFNTVYFTTTAMSTEDGTIGYVTMYYSRNYTRSASSVYIQGIDQGDSYDDGQYTAVVSHGDLA